MTYVLGFGSLWGALRTGDILPWDIDIDLCKLFCFSANLNIFGCFPLIFLHLITCDVTVYCMTNFND